MNASGDKRPVGVLGLGNMGSALADRLLDQRAIRSPCGTVQRPSTRRPGPPAPRWPARSPRPPALSTY